MLTHCFRVLLQLHRALWLTVWLAIGIPASPITFQRFGNLRSDLPVGKKVIGVCVATAIATAWRMCSSLSPSSKVSATCLAELPEALAGAMSAATSAATMKSGRRVRIRDFIVGA